MNDRYGTPPMFEQIPEQPVAKVATSTAGSGKATYTRYSPTKGARCDDCAAAFIADPNAPHSRTAAFKRTQPGAPTLLLCYPHKQMRLEAEGQ